MSVNRPSNSTRTMTLTVRVNEAWKQATLYLDPPVRDVFLHALVEQVEEHGLFGWRFERRIQHLPVQSHVIPVRRTLTVKYQVNIIRQIDVHGCWLISCQMTTSRKRSCGKVMFSQSCVYPGGGVIQDVPPGCTPTRQLAGSTHPIGMYTC